MADLISAGSFATEGERKAAKQLQHLPSTWTVICNKILPTSDGRSYEIDFIVIGNYWVFLLDEKSWRGKIRGNDEQWVRSDGSSERSPLAKADYVAKILANHIGWRVTSLKNSGYFTRSGVLLSIADQLPQIHDPRATNGLFLLSDVCQRLQKLDSQGGNPLVGQFRHQIRTSLVDLSNRPQVPQQINLFTIQDAMSVRPGVRIFQATIGENKNEPRLLMVYDLGKNPLEAQQLQDFYMHEFKALQKLHSTGLVPEVKDPFVWSEDFLILPIVPPEGRSLSAYPLPETREEFVQELLLAQACFKSLDQIHANGALHRALGPDTIYVQNGQPPKIIFTNFYAARLGTNSIAPSLDALSIEDPYASVDVAIGYEFATAKTDTYSLALILLERLSGVSISAIRNNVESSITFPDQPRWLSFLSVDLASELTALFKQVVMPDKDVPPPSTKEIATQFNNLARLLRTEISNDEGRLPDQGRFLLDKRYRVERLLGQGSMARTYLASYTDYENLGLCVLKQFQSSLVYDQAVAEYHVLSMIKSVYLPSISEIYRPQDDVHIKMEYIPGPTLQQVETEFPWPLERWWSFAQSLLNAVEVLEQKQVLHRDIKPANIILHETDNHPVLIDFGFAFEQGVASANSIAGTPLYLPPEAVSASQPPSTTDRYATGVVLFKVLTGYLPFTTTDKGQQHLISLDQIADEKIQRIATVLLRVISPDPSERPTTIGQMRNELQTALLAVEEPTTTRELPQQVNPWVQEIRSLYRNSDIGNANNRGLETQFVQETYVPTALDEHLLPSLFEQRPKVVFLSGNPGDGKTAFLEKVQQELQEKLATLTKQDPSGWEWIYKSHTFRSCYDASESHEGQSADEQLTEKLQGIEGASKPAHALTVLVAINDGRLVDYFGRNQDRFGWLSNQIEKARNVDEIEELDVWLIDLKRRSFVNMPESEDVSIFRRVLARFVAAEKWEICSSCAAQTVCPMRNNAVALRKSRTIQRLEFLFLLTHLRRQRHMTMRDLRSALAYLITGNMSCEQVHAARNGEEAGASLVNLSYWQSTFAPIERSDELLVDLTAFDPARFPHPHLDRFLHFHQALKDAEQRRLLFADKTDIPLQRFKDESDWIAAVKRRLYFDASKQAQDITNYLIPYIRWTSLLPYQYAIAFVKLLDDRIDPEKVLERLAVGMLRSDGIMSDVPPGKLTVKVSTSEEQQLLVLKQIPMDEFELKVEHSQGADMIETLPEIVLLKHISGTPRLEITLDLFELLMRMADGLQPTAPEFHPLLEDLTFFKSALLLQETRDLVLIEHQYRVHRITQREGKIVRRML